ncbi:gamma-butyrobetaine hydroxylase-like domain-containing protein [Candidatus Colwellia aromaticivorans]|uniref:gamma-butyrobetaine hydroxylase-like domain-containing protein n=1 Tax=Candidatus Colwellia aromaticivorans TaxID=2267621 RepID=UPI000DF1F7ED|nr:gamma-butyrobetaine hydroxylase-like domain-containing protein [Candidatus Colwellia aromaticivorans]
MNITGFTINNAEHNLTLKFVNSKVAQLSFEYLRVFSPTTGNKQPALVSHKKSIMLTTLENVGKHGYRLTFDDQHSAIYSSDYLEQLIKEHDQRWQHYLSELKASGHSREAMINITQL